MKAKSNDTSDSSNVKRALVLVAASLGYGLTFDYFFYGKMPGISFPLFTILALFGILAAFRWRGGSIPKSAWAVSGVLIFFSAMLFVRANEFVSLLNIAACGYLFVLVLWLLLRPDLRRFLPEEYLRIFPNVMERLSLRLSQTIDELLIVRKLATKHPNAKQVVRGTLIALPVLLVFGLLFASADLVFREYATKMFDFDINDTVIGWTVWGLAVGVVFSALLSYAQKGTEPEPASKNTPDKATKRPGLGLIETNILFASLNVLFLLFILVQIKYLFGGTHSIFADGFTYAEYARKGFFELVAVAVISFALVWTAERLLPRVGNKHPLQFRILSAVLVGQVLIVMASAFKRMSLYESAYGFTSLRLYVHMAIVWLAVIFCVLLYKIFVDERRSTFAFLAFISVLTLLAAINLINVDAFVARKNIARYNETGRIDISYLGNLSADATPEIAKLLEQNSLKNEADREQLRDILDNKKDTLYKHNSWQSTNLARDAAKGVLK